jgi:very-short-patch-repair endonuclease
MTHIFVAANCSQIDLWLVNGWTSYCFLAIGAGVVIEVDGRQHYADADSSVNTSLYAEMVSEDRRLRLSGYEVYRFGGAELAGAGADEMVSRFFDELQEHMDRR